MQEYRRTRIFAVLAVLQLLCTLAANCEDRITVTDPGKIYYSSPLWEVAGIESTDSPEPEGTVVYWKPVTLPIAGDAMMKTYHGGFLLRKHFTVSGNLRNLQIGLYTGLIRYSCSFFVNGVCIGAVGGASADDYPGGLWDTFGAFLIPSNLIRYNEDNLLTLKIRENYQLLKFTTLYLSGMKNAKESFFLDHFYFKIVQFIAAFITIFIFFPLFYLFLQNKNQMYYLYIFLSSLMYACYGLLASFDIPPFNFSIYYGILMVTLGLALAMSVMAIHSTNSQTSRGKMLRMLILILSIIASSVYFFLPSNLLKRNYHTYHFLFVLAPQILYSIFLICYIQFAKKEKLQLVFIGMFFVLVASMYDIIIDSMDTRPVLWLSPIGVIIFSVMLFIQIANRYTNDVRVTERNTVKLQYTEVLMEEKERLDVTLNSIGDAVICTEMDGTVTLFNKAAEEITSCAKGGAIGNPLADILTLEKEHEDAAGTNVISELLTQSDSQVLSQGPYQLLQCDGRSHSILVTKAQIKDRTDESIGLVWVFHDITEREKLETVHRRNQTLESLGILASGIAHDFNNIFMAILLNIGLAKRISPEGNNETLELLSGAEHAVAKASLLTRELLTFAKGGLPTIQFLDIRPFIMASASFASEGTDINISYKLAPDLWLAEVDVGQISQVIYNLVLNAIQALPQGGAIEIEGANLMLEQEMAYLSKGEYTIIKVSDNGIGIKKEHLSRIFDPYFTTKQNGTGLGLTSVLSIVKKHRGHIEVASEENKGTTFTMYLHAKSEPMSASARTLRR
jgi:PAS domain S-box-containing protein